MNKRLFILGSVRFPRGSAGANYEQYFALALIELGWKVIILGQGENRKQDFNGDTYQYHGIEYYNTPSTKTIKYGMGVKFYKDMVSKYHIKKDDYFVIRAFGWQPLKWWIKKFRTNRISYIHFDDVKPTQFKKAYVNPQYWANIYAMKIKYSKIKKAFPISMALEKKEKKYNCRTLRLPIMADPEEFGFLEKKEKPSVVQFIYPGAKLNGCEDDIDTMLGAFSLLKENEKKHYVLHITGTSKEKLAGRIKKPRLVESLGENLVLHSWMEYTELIGLYKTIDFLVLSRYDNELTRANFPSKIPENLCFGIVPICSNVGDYTKHYLKDGVDSIFFEVGSQEGLAESLKRAINMPNQEYLKMRTCARSMALNRFGYKNWAKKIEDFIVM